MNEAVISRNWPDGQPSYPNATNRRAYYTAAPPGSFSDQQRRWSICVTFFTIFTLAILLSFAISFTVWFSMVPIVPEFQLDSAFVSFFSVSKSWLTANWDLGFTIRNPNKIWTVNYDSFVAYMIYDREELAKTSLLPFHQVKRNHTTMQLRLNFSAASAYVSDDAAKSLAVGRSRGAVNFNVKLVNWIRFTYGVWTTEWDSMSVYCKNMTVLFSSNSEVGSLSGGSRGCYVSVMK